MIFITFVVCVSYFQSRTSLLGVAVVYIRRSIYNLFFFFINVCPYDNNAGVGSGKVRQVNRLTKPVGWL